MNPTLPQEGDVANTMLIPSISSLSTRIATVFEELKNAAIPCQLEKENVDDLNNARREKNSKITNLQELAVTRVEELLVLVEEAMSHYKSSQFQLWVCPPSPSIFLIRVRQLLSKMLAKLKDMHIAKKSHQESQFCLKTFHQLLSLFQNAYPQQDIITKPHPNVVQPISKVNIKSSKRSLLTEKIKLAELQQEQSEQLLINMRVNPSKVQRKLMNQYKTLKPTAPVTLESECKEKFNFSELSSIDIAESFRAESKILSQMSMISGSRERKAKREGVGCSRCEIY